MIAQQKQKQNPQKKIHKASQKGSKVVFANTAESKALLELTIQIDILYRDVRNKMGTQIDIEDASIILNSGKELIEYVANFTQTLADSIAHKNYIEPASVSILRKKK